MQNFRIFTESPADVKFLSDFITEAFAVDLKSSDFDTLGSWSGYKAGGELKASIRENVLNERATILILDADNNFETRSKEIWSDLEKYNVTASVFLFPDNNSQGSLETLLAQIAVERRIIDCFEAYERCIEGFQTPVIKSKIFAYLDALLPPSSKKGSKGDLIKEENRNYRNQIHWNLKHDALNPLNDFLANHLI